MKIALAQINTTVGDLAGNEAKILDSAARARSERRGAGAVSRIDHDRLSAAGFVAQKGLHCQQPGRAGTPRRRQRADRAAGGLRGRKQERPGRDVTNAAALLQNGSIVATRTKTLLADLRCV